MSDWSAVDARLGRDSHPDDEPAPPADARPVAAPDGGAGGWEAFDNPDAPEPQPATPDRAEPPTATVTPAPDGGAGGWEAFDDPGGAQPLPDQAETPQLVPQSGDTVYRVWGRPEFPIPNKDPDLPDLEGSGPWGRSWTPVDPSTVPDYRSGMGLPDVNTGQFLSEGLLLETGGVQIRPAQPLDGNPGGLPELVVPDPVNQVELRRVSGLNPNV